MRSRDSTVVEVITGAVLLLATIAAFSIAIPENTFAYKKNQATSQTDACEIPINVGCQNTNSQIQGDENSAALTVQQTFPEVEPATLYMYVLSF